MKAATFAALFLAVLAGARPTAAAFMSYPGTPQGPTLVDPSGSALAAGIVIFSGSPELLSNSYLAPGKSQTGATPGDLIFLLDPNGGDGAGNWAAVARFFNPQDPMGSQGLKPQWRRRSSHPTPALAVSRILRPFRTWSTSR